MLMTMVVIIVVVVAVDMMCEVVVTNGGDRYTLSPISQLSETVNCPRAATNVHFAFSHKELKMAKCPCRDEADVEVHEGYGEL